MTRRPRSRRLVCPHPLDPVWPGAFFGPRSTPQLRRSGHLGGGEADVPAHDAEPLAPQLPGRSPQL